jgi:hypothetical protein
MPSLWDYFLLCCGLFAELSVVVLAILRRDVRRYFPLALFMLASAAGSVALLYCLRRFGIASSEYAYLFYATDCAIVILLYGVVAWFYACIFARNGARWSTRLAGLAIMLLLGVIGFIFVRSNPARFLNSGVIDIERNLYFSGLLLTWFIWPASIRLREQRPRWILLVLSLGVFFSGHAACFSLQSLFPSWSLPRMLPAVLELLLPVAWTLTFLRVPEEGRPAVRAVPPPQISRARLA